MKFNDLIKTICLAEGINFKVLSNNYLIELEKKGIKKYIWGHKFSLNDHAIGELIDDKYALYEVCKSNNIPIIKHELLYKKDLFSKLRECFNKFNKDVVIKPNTGSKGSGVYHLTNYDELYNVCDKLFLNNYSLSICPFYEIKKEYRVIILDGKVEMLYEKNKPMIIGDGIKTIKELLLELNPFYFKNKDLEEFNKVLDKGEVFTYDWRFNLSKGGIAKLVNDKSLEEKLTKMALKVTNLLNTKFVSVDIIDTTDDLFIMEINSGVCISHVCNFIDKDYVVAKKIYRDAINLMFSEK